MLLADITLPALQAATKAQIVAKITDKLALMTKRQLVALVWSVVAPDDITVADAPIIVTRKDGQIESQVEVTRDALGVRTGGRMTTWTYFENEKGKPVDTITISERDAADKETAKRVIKHFMNGKQPEVVGFDAKNV